MSDLGQKLPEFVIIGGDFNLCLTNLDKMGGNMRLKQNAIIEIESLMNRFNICDIFRDLHPDEQKYTYPYELLILIFPLLTCQKVQYRYLLTCQ